MSAAAWPRRARKTRKAEEAVPAQGEMLMPITGRGKGKAKDAAKPAPKRKAG